MSFRLIPKSVTLNGVMALILRYFTEFVYDVMVKKFTFADSSLDEFLVNKMLIDVVCRIVKQADVHSGVYKRCEYVIGLNSRLCFQQADLFAMSESPSDVFLDLMTQSTLAHNGTFIMVALCNRADHYIFAL